MMKRIVMATTFGLALMAAARAEASIIATSPVLGDGNSDQLDRTVVNVGTTPIVVIGQLLNANTGLPVDGPT